MDRTPTDSEVRGSIGELLFLWLLFALLAPILGLVGGGLVAVVIAGEPPGLPAYKSGLSTEEQRIRTQKHHKWEFKAARAQFITWGVVSLFGLAAAIKAGFNLGYGVVSPKWKVFLETLMFLLIVAQYTLLAPFMFFAWIFRNG
jgi:hypothetical protein